MGATSDFDMDRRRLLETLVGGAVPLATAGAVTGVAGCLASPVRPNESPTTSPPVESRVEVPPCPERPEPLTGSGAATFAVRFERAYVTRRILRENDRVTYVDFLELEGTDGSSATVTEIDGGFEVRFSARPAYGYRQHPGTPESAHVDFAEYRVDYFVGDAAVRRATASEGTPVEPRTNGTAVSCPPT